MGDVGVMVRVLIGLEECCKCRGVWMVGEVEPSRDLSSEIWEDFLEE